METRECKTHHSNNATDTYLNTNEMLGGFIAEDSPEHSR